MGREVRRVPIDFDWPLNKVWKGFLLPDSLSERPCDACEPTDPPEGEGWQYWETVSEGSPISPVFATAEALSHWLQTDYRWGSGGPLTKEQADSMVQTGWAPSFIVDSTGFHHGDEVAASA